MSGTQEVMEAIKELRSEVELKTKDVGKIDKIEKFLDEQEKKNADLVKQIQEKEAKQAEFEQKLANIEKDLMRTRSGGETKVTPEEVKSFDKLVREGKEELTADEKKYLRSNSGQEGGFLVPVDYVREVIKGITEISPMRSLARVRPTSGNEIHLPKRTSLLTAQWVGEGKLSTPSNSKYGLEKIVVHKMMVPVEITHEQLKDAAFSCIIS